MIAGPFVCLDFAATPTVTDDGHGGTVTTYPPLAGVFAITDLATYARSADALSAYRVTQAPAQHVLGGDDPANPTLTVTLQFADQATFDAVTGPVNALPPVAYAPADLAAQPANPRVISRIDFIERFPIEAQGTLATSADPMLVAARFKLLAISAVELDNASTQQLVGYMAQLGIITPAEAALVLA